MWRIYLSSSGFKYVSYRHSFVGLLSGESLGGVACRWVQKVFEVFAQQYSGMRRVGWNEKGGRELVGKGWRKGAKGEKVKKGGGE